MWTTASRHANALRLPPCFGCSELGSPPFAEPRRRNRQLNMPVLVAAMLRLDHYPRGGVRILVSQAGNRCRILRCIQVAACDYCRPFIDLVHCESRQRTPRGQQKAPWIEEGPHPPEATTLVPGSSTLLRAVSNPRPTNSNRSNTASIAANALRSPSALV